MWFVRKKLDTLRFTNTLSGQKEEFKALKAPTAKVYSCGPTVYGPQHIGNMRAALFSDTLARALSVAGYKVQRVINITDVGHLVGDGDVGEDKISVGAKRENVSPKEIADRYAKQYLSDIRTLNVVTKTIRFPRATDYIPDQIAMIKTLEKRGHTYTLADGVYFDTATFPAYGKLGKRNEAELLAGARVDMVEGKKHPQDFVLWRKAKPEDLQQWPSPWGAGNPGWSIECSAMIRALLGNSIDIHTGGEEHVGVHHNNEIAQSEGSTGKSLANYWLHNAFLTIDGEKVSKSLGNTYVVDDISARKIHPLALRYLFLQAHYRSPLSFTWESLEAAQEALIKLWLAAHEVRRLTKGRASASPASKTLASLVYDDLGTPKALAYLWEQLSILKNPKKKWHLLKTADALFGLSLLTPPTTVALKDVDTVVKREKARKNKDFATADQLRIHMENRGYRVYDGPLETTYIKTVK